jgi:hypothetical protein
LERKISVRLTKALAVLLVCQLEEHLIQRLLRERTQLEVESDDLLKPHKKRFEAWRKRLKPNAAFLVDQVLERIVPQFTAKGYEWFDDFAGGNPQEIGMNEIPLQRRQGDDWPTVQIRFHPSRPNLQVTFAQLPPVCKKNFGATDIPKLLAPVVYAPAYFSIVKERHKNNDNLFGYSRMALFPQKRLLNEIAMLDALLPTVLDRLDQRFPTVWLTAAYGPVAKNIWLEGSWHIDDLRRAENDRKKSVSNR